MEGKEDKVMSYTNSVQLRFSHTEKEYLAAVRFYFLNSKELMTRMIVFHLLISGGMLLLNVLLEFLFPLWALIAFMILLGVAWFHAIFVDLPRRYFRNDPKFRQEYNLTFTDAGIEFKTEALNASIAWSFYTGVAENQSFYLLIYGESIASVSIVPKRAFLNAEQETAFRAMLRRNVDRNLKLSDVESEKSEYVPASLQPPDWR